DDVERAVLSQRAEDLARAMCEDLAVREREVRGGAHGREVLAPFGRRERRARELAIGQRDAVAGDRVAHSLHVGGADLMATPARAGVNEDRDPIEREAEGARRGRVEDRLNALDLEKVVAAAERPELILAALLRAIGHRRRERAGQAAAALDPLEI